jgi:hypothetical protein
MKEFIIGLGLGMIFMGVLLGIMVIDYQREYRRLEAEAYEENYNQRKEIRRLNKEIRLLYNSRR